MRTARRLAFLLFVGVAVVATACGPTPSSGGGDTSTTTTTIPAQPPVAVGHVNPAYGISPLLVSFDATGSDTNPTGGVLSSVSEIVVQLARFEPQVGLLGVALRADRDVLADGHRHGACHDWRV